MNGKQDQSPPIPENSTMKDLVNTITILTSELKEVVKALDALRKDIRIGVIKISGEEGYQGYFVPNKDKDD